MKMNYSPFIPSLLNVRSAPKTRPENATLDPEKTIRRVGWDFIFNSLYIYFLIYRLLCSLATVAPHNPNRRQIIWASSAHKKRARFSPMIS